MRQRKYKAWIKSLRQWQTPEVVEWTPIRELGTGNVTDYEWVEFTGLLDQAGVEVWEGDLVGSANHPKPLGVVRFGKVNLGCNGFEYDDWVIGFYVEDVATSSPQESYTQWLIRGELTVIGNIFEHPEMLSWA